MTVGCCLLVAASGVQAAVYYVDFDGGSDYQPGTSPATAFKHSPGDGQAAGTAAATNLQPGDTVIFKGGVYYRSSIDVNQSGASGNPITYDGNTAGTFGTGRAIVDGSELLTGWTQCASAAEAGGNPNWANIYYAYAPAGSSAFSSNIFQDEQMLWLSQDPNPADPFYQDKTTTYNAVPVGSATRTSLIDASYFTQPDSTYWDGSYIAIWAQPNYTYFQKVTGYAPAEQRVTFESLSTDPYADRDTLYSMINSVHIIDTPGEYYFNETAEPDGTNKVWLWPFAGGGNWDQQVSISRRNTAFNISGHSFVTVQGLLIQKFITQPPHRGAAVSNNIDNAESIVVRDNIIRYCNKDSTWKHAGINFEGVVGGTIEDNQIYENRRIGGVYLLGGSTGVLVRNNTIRKCGYQGIWCIGAPNSQIIGNTVTDNLGVHSNGITIYHGSNNTLVFGNTVTNSNVAFASEVVSDVTIAYNIFLSDSIYVVCNWYDSTNLRFYNNVILGPQAKALMLSRSGTTNCTVKNNILAGLLINAPFDVSHNLYVDHYQGLGNLDPALLVNAIIEPDLNAIFVDPASGNYRLRAGSPAIDAGTDVGQTQDHDGYGVPAGPAVDIGAFEYAAAPPQVSAWYSVVTHGGSEIAAQITEDLIDSRVAAISKLQINFSGILNAATVNNSSVAITGDTSGDLSGQISNVSLVDGYKIVVTLSSALPDGERFTLTVNASVTDSAGQPVTGDRDIRLAVLAGDVDGSGAVTAADLAAIRGQTGQTVDATSSRWDVDRSGAITAADMRAALQHMGNALP